MHGRKGSVILGVLGIIAFLIVAVVAIKAFAPKTPTVTPTPTPTVLPTSGGSGGLQCNSATSPAVTFRGKDVYTGASSGQQMVYRKQGLSVWTNANVGTALTLEKNQKYEVLVGINTPAANWSSASSMVEGSYFVTDPVPCDPAVSYEVPVYSLDIPTGITATIYNQDGTANYAKNMTDGSSNIVSFKLVASTNKVYGNPAIKGTTATSFAGNRPDFPNTLVWQQILPWFQPPTGVKATVNGQMVDLKAISCPNGRINNTNTSSYCYDAPVIDSNGVTFQVAVNVKSGQQPSPVSLRAIVIPGGWYLESANTPGFGPQDSFGNSTITTAVAGGTGSLGRVVCFPLNATTVPAPSGCNDPASVIY